MILLAALTESLNPPASARAEAGAMMRWRREARVARDRFSGVYVHCADRGDRTVVARAGASRLLPVQARAGTGASGADATFLFGISTGQSVRTLHLPD